MQPECQTEELRALYGHVVLQAAMAAAALGDQGRADELTGEARDVARFVTPGSDHYRRLVRLAQDGGWQVCVLASPAGRRFADIPGLEEATGYPVRSEYKDPGEPDVLPPPDAIIVAPATVNTINKWAAGMCDALPLGILVEAIGKRLPIVAMPFTNRAHAAHPAFPENIAKLRSWGVTVLFGPGVSVARQSQEADWAGRADAPQGSAGTRCWQAGSHSTDLPRW